ncbi:hypothetical protein J2752_000934 [Halarchaeum rubridurum]|uniref:Profilin fold domain-containing protein n=1 Tax=Halarchaeum rubridurum TaxID=489911 RepID=A0A830FXQ9_9EURY|nr:hypothetical protein [Halarchaeum rubridurum]MBP1954053.1 hypothetical protein [Halarchaeum rubridurum]GGM56978.1 hypothetical protein GCM10009017_03920 [Halarchaeum rubridurum]
MTETDTETETDAERVAVPVPTADAAAAERDRVVARVREHAGRLARELARLQGGDYGRRTFRVEGGEWTLKYEAGDLDFLRFEGRAGLDVYVVSTKTDPEIPDLAAAMDHYEAFVAAFADYVDSLGGVLDGVPETVPDVASTGDVAAERDRLVSRMREAADRMAAELHRVEPTEYGTFAATVEGTRWELKREADRASYVRAGGEGGVYLVSQYAPPSPGDVRTYAPGFRGFVEAFNAEVDELGDALDGVEL